MIKFSKPSVEQFFRTYNITNFTVTDNEEKLLFSSNLNGKMNVWALDMERGYPYLFAHTEQACSFLKADPKMRYVLGGFDHDGDENYHIYAFPYEGGPPKELIKADKSDKYFYVHLSEDGSRLYYITSKGNPQFLNGYVYHMEEDRHEQLYSGEDASTFVYAVSADERYLVLVKFYANTYKVGYLKDLKTGEIKTLSQEPDRVHEFAGATFVSDDELLFITNDESEFNYVVKYHIPTGTQEKYMEFEDESVTSIQWHKDSKTLYMVTEKGVEDYIYRFADGESTPTEVPCPLTSLDSVKVAKSGRVYVLGRSAVEPFNIYASTPEGDWTKLTDNRVLGISQEDMVDPEVVSYSSFDGKEIEALWFKAKPEQDNGHVIFWPHGGPQAAERKMFRAMFQCFLNRGYSIFAPNFRGSTGYGATFKKLVEQDWGEGPRLDCVAGIEWLFETGKCDRDRLFVLGGSYGGYMTLLLAGRHSEYFRAVIDIFGVSNLFTFVNSVPDHWKPIMERWVGDPVRDKERFEKDSPITYLSSMTKPMLVIQGANDPRVVKEESDQIVEALQKQGTEVEYLVLDDEGHGFSKKENEIKVYKQILDFLEKHR
ncbi:dipeptidyl aminopeptidase/acylaminoacyl peptidase [Evansella vedderi]|uniref:Dipeptidyl aminopeptidase/acylaminoacyl peptidase n=1 Tax=Evansella vedderi TaxID=38282 RepID=A0ABT9ZVF1_9BACI|nr:S9 family peptidase [Evansella vedderi]MDQ0255216.1 dipeptidyl aminopeptidase/acylaminoacyl peptidase [Evansella vedderi]